MKTENSGVNLLRFLAIVLVINSHMDAFYPIPVFGTGGAIGNALFFVLSAYGLMLSEKNRPQRFQDYLAKRVRRIYPIVWMSTLVLIFPLLLFYYFKSPENFSILINEFALNNPLSFLSIIFYPPSAFWFLQAMMIFYVFGFSLIKNGNNKKLIYGTIILGLIYITLYLRAESYNRLIIEQEMNFKLVFYFLIFTFGIFLASVESKIKYQGVVDYFMLLLFILVIYGHKLLVMMTGGNYSEFQFVQQMAIFPLVFYFLKISRSDRVGRLFNIETWAGRFVSLVAAMTLELYIVHGPLRGLMLPYLGGFPGNVIVYLPFVFITAYVLHELTNKATRIFLGRQLS
jgi:peptidoglycan/LPS O-acetylase OafA/YrhL